MKHSLRPLVALLALALATGGAGLIGTRPRALVPVYSLAEVRAHLARDPGAWVGRIVEVRGRAVGAHCLWPAAAPDACPDPQPSSLVDPSGALPLTAGAAAPLLAAVRRVPLLWRVLPAPQVVDWAAPATYRVQLLAAPAADCGHPPCFRALLLDAAPDALGEG
jgi:hypothetical protein